MTDAESRKRPGIVPCPECGKDKWRYIGTDLDYEPPCWDCKSPTREIEEP